MSMWVSDLSQGKRSKHLSNERAPCCILWEDILLAVLGGLCSAWNFAVCQAHYVTYACLKTTVDVATVSLPCRVSAYHCYADHSGR